MRHAAFSVCTRSERATAAAGTSMRRTVRTGEIAGFGLLAAERIETIGECDHPVARQGVVCHVLNIVTGHRTLHIAALLQYIVIFQHDRRILPFQELVRNLGIPQPLLRVVTG